MRTPDQLKPFLLREDPYVRVAVIDYFADAWSRDPDILPLVLDGLERFGNQHQTRILSLCQQLLLTEPSLDRILLRLNATQDPESVDVLNRIIAHAPSRLLAARQSDILGHAKLTPEIIPQVRLRCDLAGWSGERLWDELQAYARRSDDAGDEVEIDDDYVAALVDALAVHDVPDDGTICELLRSLEPEEGWLEVFLVDLAGERRIARAVPALAGKLQIDSDYLQEGSRAALAKIGDPEAVRLIRAAYPNAPETFKYYAPFVPAAIKDVESEETLIALLEIETESTFRTMLCAGLCDLFSERGIGVVMEEIASGYDTWYCSLEDRLLPVAEVLGVELPEADSWKRQRADREKRFAERLAAMADLDLEPLFKIAKPLGIDRPARPEPKGIPTPVVPSYGPTMPIRRAQPKVGRNDPCPCGSGKKFKKCCGRNG